MIDYRDETVTIYDPELQKDVMEKIVSWEVWFVTGEGTFRQMIDAKASCIRLNDATIIPVPVAIGEKIFEIIVGRPL